MLLVWFGLVLGLSLILVLFGYFLSSPPLAIAGSGLIFLLGSIVMFSDLQIETGFEETYIYGVNLTDYHFDGYNVSLPNSVKLDVPLLFHSEHNKTYSAILEEEVVGIGINRLLGFILSLIGVFIFIDILSGLRGLK